MPVQNVEVARPCWRVSYRGWLVVVVIAAVLVSGISPFDRRDWLLEHLPTAFVLAFLVCYERRSGGGALDDLACTMLFVLLMLHVIGAHFLYSRVPYDDWLEALFGFRTTAEFGTTRNQYDRFVHLCFGLLATLPIAEIVHRHVTTQPVWAVVVAVAFVALLGKLYEIAEWLIAIAMSTTAAENYNGQQGDVFDAQKDMALAFVGSLTISPFAAAWLRRRREKVRMRTLRPGACCG